MSVTDDKAGKTGKCPKCQTAFLIPTPEAGSAAPAPPPPPPVQTTVTPVAPPTPAAVEINPCPGCQGKLTVAAANLGVDVSCPYCQTVFKAVRAGASAVPPPAPPRVSPMERTDGTGRPKLRRDDENDDDRPRRRRRDEDEDERPRRRRDEDEDEDDDDRSARRRTDDDDEYDRPRPRRRAGRGRTAEAKALVGPPAITLMVLGGVGFAIAIAGLFFNLTGVGNQPNNMRAFGGAGQFAHYIGLILPFVWATVVMFSGYQMKSLSNWGSALVGIIFAMLPCNVCCLVGIPIGIWALVVMMKPEVKDAFR
jgi:hypothetical protein